MGAFRFSSALKKALKPCMAPPVQTSASALPPLCALADKCSPLAQARHLNVFIFKGQAGTPAALLGAATAHYIFQFSPLKNDKAMREAGKSGRLTIRSKDKRQRAWERVRGPRLRPLRLPGKSARDACFLPIKCSSSELTGEGCAPGNPEALARPITCPVRGLLTEIRWGSDRFWKVKFAIY